MDMPLWVFWLGVGIAAAIGEVMSAGLFLASVAVAALITAIVAFFLPASIFLAVQVVVFAALSLLGIAVLRPVVMNALGWHPTDQITGPTYHSHLSGKRAVVTRAVDANGGQIRIGEGEFWSARAFDPDDSMAAGQTVEIVLVEGLTALVAPLPQPALDSPVSVEKGTQE